MNRYPAEPQRLVDLPAEQDLVGVSELVRAAAATSRTREIAPATRQRIRARLYTSLSEPGRVFHHRWRQALVLALVLAVGGVVGAATHSVILKRQSPKTGVAPAAAPEISGQRRIAPRSPRSAQTAPEMPTAQDPPPLQPLEPLPAESPPAENPSVQPLPAKALPSPTAAPSRGASSSPLPAVASPPRTSLSLVDSPSPSAIPPKAQRRATAAADGPPLPRSLHAAASPRASAPLVDGLSPPAPQVPPPAEAAVLAAAIRKLRVDGDAAAALSLLDQRAARFADSVLGPEASAVRIEALLKLGRVDAALSDLERLPLQAVPRRDEWQVVRGELRAQAGRWSSAEADFTAVLSGRLRASDGDLVERALWGRAAARSHQGDLAGARVDSTEYLRRFPGGRFANQAKQALVGR